MVCFRLLLEYDGGDFAGWQIQAQGERTVQGVLGDAVRCVTGNPARIVGAGRTDAGVHAEGQVASLHVDTPLGPERLKRALNANLPTDVCVLELVHAADGFDPRRSARSKLYRYRIWNGADRSPLRRGRCAHVARRLSLAPMTQAARALEGTHDFACFMASGSGVRSSVRRIDRLDVLGAAGAEIVIEVEGPGFLRHMVRNIVGTLIEIGWAQRSPDSVVGLLASKNRGLAGPTAPAPGLTLVRVDTSPTPRPGSGVSA